MPISARAARVIAVLIALAAAVVMPSSALAVDVVSTGFEDIPVVDGLTQPTAVAWAPDGRMFILEKEGRLKVLSPGGDLAELVYDFSDHVNNFGDRGALGLALDPAFATNHSVYLLYTYEHNGADPFGAKSSRLARVEVAADNTLEHATTPETVVLGSTVGPGCGTPSNTLDCLSSDEDSHSIGTVRAAPDGTLWVGVGDGASYNFPDLRALRSLDETSLNGKILHVDQNGQGLPGHPFCPADNNLSHACTKVHAGGFRNPFRFTIAPSGVPVGGDVGWNTWEEVNIAQPGRMYGWPCWEGGMDGTAPKALEEPEYSGMPECQGTTTPRMPPGHTRIPRSPGTTTAGGPRRWEALRIPQGVRSRTSTTATSSWATMPRA